ncbi:MAG TPA: hypothetical protein EYO58_09870, partial [Flavobacteriales bacterium]|nr:hypothetical protein [Flavobacteriales bacterium]
APSTLPSGLTFSNGDISGIPDTITPETTYTITATNSVGETDTFNLTFSVIQPLDLPFISSYPNGNSWNLQEGFTTDSMTPTMTGGAASSFQILESKYISDIGLTFDTNDGTISGTINQDVDGTYIYKIQATNATGDSNVIILTYVITDDAPTPTLDYGNGNSFSLNTISGNQSYTANANISGTWSMNVKNDSGASIPNQITFNSQTGEISIDPSTVLSSTEFTVSLTNSDNETSTLTVTFEVIEAIPTITNYKNHNTNAIISSGDTITIDEGESLDLRPNNITNMPSTISNYIISSSTDLANTGISVNGTTGEISASSISNHSAQVAAYTITIKPNNGIIGSDFIINVTINDDYPTPNISTTDSGAFTSGNDVSITFTNTGGPINSWAINPSLPNGLSFNTGTGEISGTAPLITYNEEHTITATNGESETSEAKVTIDITIGTPEITNYINNIGGATISNGGSITINEGSTLSLSPNTVVNMSTSSSQYLLQNSSELTNTGISVNANTGLITGTISNVSAGSYFIKIKPNNGSEGSEFVINVTINDD